MVLLLQLWQEECWANPGCYRGHEQGKYSKHDCHKDSKEPILIYTPSIDKVRHYPGEKKKKWHQEILKGQKKQGILKDIKDYRSIPMIKTNMWSLPQECFEDVLGHGFANLHVRFRRVRNTLKDEGTRSDIFGKTKFL